MKSTKKDTTQNQRKKFTVRLPLDLVAKIDILVVHRDYKNRNQFIEAILWKEVSG